MLYECVLPHTCKSQHKRHFETVIDPFNWKLWKTRRKTRREKCVHEDILDSSTHTEKTEKESLDNTPDIVMIQVGSKRRIWAGQRHPSGLRYQEGQRQTNLCLDDRKCVTCGMSRQRRTSTEQNAKRWSTEGSPPNTSPSREEVSFVSSVHGSSEPCLYGGSMAMAGGPGGGIGMRGQSQPWLSGDSQVGSTENGPRHQSHLWRCVMEPMPIHTAASPCRTDARRCYGHWGSLLLSF